LGRFIAVQNLFIFSFRVKNKLLSTTLFLLIGIATLIISDIYFTTKIPKNSLFKQYWLLNKKQCEYDLAFIGPSRVLNTIDAFVFEDQLGLKPINLGLSGVGYAEQYLLLDLLLEQNKLRIKKLNIEIGTSSVINPDSAYSYPFHEFFYFPYINNDTVFKIILDNSKNKSKAFAWKYVPFFRYAEFNSNFLPMVFFPFTIDETIGDKKFDIYGSILIDKQKGDDAFESQYIENLNINGKTITYLEKMIRLAQNHNIEVILFTAPMYKNSLTYSGKALMNYENLIASITLRYNIKYFNFSADKICADKGNFYDRGHLNKKGAKAFSEIFCDSLRKNIFAAKNCKNRKFIIKGVKRDS
jgi:hypothetical protein